MKILIASIWLSMFLASSTMTRAQTIKEELEPTVEVVAETKEIGLENPTPTSVLEPTESPTETPTETPSLTPLPTSSPTETPIPSGSLTPTETPQQTPTVVTPTPTETIIPPVTDPPIGGMTNQEDQDSGLVDTHKTNEVSLEQESEKIVENEEEVVPQPTRSAIEVENIDESSLSKLIKAPLLMIRRSKGEEFYVSNRFNLFETRIFSLIGVSFIVGGTVLMEPEFLKRIHKRVRSGQEVFLGNELFKLINRML